jgi:hypothetical protein
MTAIPKASSPFLAFYIQGQASPAKESGPNGITLSSGTTYYVEAGGDASLVQAIQLDWDASVILVADLEDTLWDPGVEVGQASTSQVAGRAWCPENPTTAYVGASGGATVTGTSVSVPGTTAGTAIWHVGTFGSTRLRLKIVVGGTGGNVNARTAGKM